jgi:hypothetical protein
MASVTLPIEKQNGQPKPEPPPNPFDPARLRLSQDFAAHVGVKKLLTTVPCRKPNRHEFVRVRAGEDWRLTTAIYTDKANRDEAYVVDPSLHSELAAELYPACLFSSITRQGDFFLWPCRLPGTDGRSSDWHSSALVAAQAAETQWVRVVANMGAGYYDVHVATGNLSEPEWPDLKFAEILRLAFKSRFIESLDHPVLKALRGEA